MKTLFLNVYLIFSIFNVKALENSRGIKLLLVLFYFKINFAVDFKFKCLYLKQKDVDFQ